MDGFTLLVKQRLHSKGWWLGMGVVALGYAYDNLSLVQDLLAEHYGLTLMIIGGLKVVVRELTKGPLSDKI